MVDSITQNQLFLLICLSLAVFRVYLEVIGFDFAKLPITSRMHPASAQKFHKMGLYICIGYIILFAPEYLMM